MKYVITEHGQVWRESKFRARFYEPARLQDSKGGGGAVRLDRPDVPKRKAPVHLLDHRIPYVPKVERNRYNHRPKVRSVERDIVLFGESLVSNDGQQR